MSSTSTFLPLQLIRIFAIAVLFACFAFAALAQSALDGFDPNANGAVRAVVVQPDGKILLGGVFTTLSPNGGTPVVRNHIARLNPDGTLDTAFDPNVDGSIVAIAVQANGQILIGGLFTTVSPNGTAAITRNNIARLNLDGTLDANFDPNANGNIFSIAVQTDGKVLAGGLFTSIGGQTRNFFARLDGTTGLADSFEANSNAPVSAITLQPDGKILVGGSFINIGGQVRNHIARLDPVTALADSFDPNASHAVLSIAVQADGKVLAGGQFLSMGGQQRYRIARLEPVNGVVDAFNPIADNTVNSVVVQADGDVLLGGFFTTIGPSDRPTSPNGPIGQPRNYIARIDSITGLPDSFKPDANQAVFSIAVQQDGKILAGGVFTTLRPNGGAFVTRNNIARIEKDGRVDQTLDLGLAGPFGFFIYAIAIQPDGKIIIGGNFNSVLGVVRNNIARLNSDGTLDLTFNPNAGSNVYSIVVQADGKILVGGLFSNIGGQARNRLARLDASTGLADSFNPNANGFVATTAVQQDGKILVGGGFSAIGAESRLGIARLDATTGMSDSWNPNADWETLSIAIEPSGKILAGGAFNNIGGQSRNGIARLDATTGLADSFDPNANSTLFSVAVQADGKILAGGLFFSGFGTPTIGGQSRNRIARLDAATGIADVFDPNSNNPVTSIAVQADGKILVGGQFHSGLGTPTIGGQTRNRIARLEVATGAADLWNPDASSGVDAIAVLADGKILAGGTFTTIGGQTRAKFARLNNDTIATQNLGVSQTSVTWSRGGSVPQFSRVTFEESTDGVNYNFLGNGTAAGSNWTLTGLSLPTSQNLYIRARGFYRGGFRNGSESVEESVRNAYFVAAPTIAGTVTYGNAIGAPTPRFVSNVLLSGTGSVPVSVFSSFPSGTYSLSGFGSGAYTVTPTKTGGVNAITSFDAARVAQHAAGVNSLTGNQLVVADVSGNGSVSSFDAGQIARYASGVQGFGATGSWRFTPANRNYASVAGNITGEDFIALLMGEVSGNWTNTGARPLSEDLR